MKKMFNYTGRRFGSQVVIRFDHRHPSGQPYLWLCRCDCGKERLVAATSLRSGNSKSCGCGIRKSSKITHGMSYSLEERAWSGIKQRCLYKTWKFYPNYGGRGIKACAFILESPAHLITLIGKCPGKGWTVDRENNNGNYSCGSCAECIQKVWPLNIRWATKRQQASNRRTSRSFTFNGVTTIAAEWARQLGISAASFSARVKSGKTGSDLFFIGDSRKHTA